MQLHNQPNCSLVSEQAIDRHLLTVARDNPLPEVIASLQSGDSSRCALVMEESRLVGLFSEHNIISLNLAQRHLEKVKVAEVMTTPVITLNISNLPDIFILSSLLQQHQIHHLPVVGDRDQILGVITPQSICRVLEKEISNLNSAFANLESAKGENLSSVTQDRSKGSEKIGLIAPNTSQHQQLEGSWQQAKEKLAITVEAPATYLKEPYETLSVKVAKEQSFKTLLVRERQYKSVVDNVKEVFFQTDTAGFWTFLNPAWTEITGFSIEESLDTNFLNYIHPDDRQHNLELFQLLINGEKDYCKHEIRYLTKDGDYRWIEVYVSLTFADDNAILGTCGTLNDITERKQAEFALQESELRFRSLVSNIPGVVYRSGCDSDWTMEFIGDAIAEISGYPPSDFIHNKIRTFASIIHPEDTANCENLVLKAVKERQLFLAEYRIIRADGSIRWVYDRGQGFFSDDGSVLWLDGAIFDITERKRAEAELEKSNQRTIKILESITDAFFALDKSWCFTYLNSKAEQYLLKTRDELIGKCIWDELPEVANSSLIKQYHKAVSENITIHFETFYGSSNTWYQLQVYPYEDGLSVYCHDITERKQAEVALQESEARYRAVVEDQTEMICRFLPDGSLSFVNDAYCRFFNKQPKELVGQTFAPFMLEEKQEWITQEMAFLTPEKSVLSYEHQVVMPSKEICIQQWTNRAIFNEFGQFVEFQAVGRDITLRKAAEKALAKRERHWAALVTIGRRLLVSNDKESCYKQVLKTLGTVSRASRIYVFENHTDESGCLRMSQRAEWCGEGVNPKIDNPLLQNLSYDDYFPRWANQLARGKIVSGVVAKFPESERQVLEPQGILSILVLPMIVNDKFFGFIGFDNCYEARPWASSDVDILRAAATAISMYQQRRLAELALRESEERFRQLAENIDEVFWMTNPDKTQIIYISSAFEKIWGRTCESLYNNPKYWVESIHPEDRDRIVALIRNNPQRTLNEEYRIVRPDGSVRWVWDRAFPIRNAAGEICRITGLAEDITERKSAQQTLLRISAAVEKSSDAIGISGVNAEPIYINEAFRNLFGYSLDELDTSGGLALLFTQKAVNQEVFATVNGGKSWRGEVEMRSRSGCIIQISLRTDAIKDTSGQVVGSIAIFTDITERLQAEQALRESEEKYRNLVEQTNDWVWEIDSNGVFTYVSPKASDIAGYQVGEILGKTTFNFMSPDEAKRFQSVLNYFVSAQQPFSNLEKTVIHKNGHSIVLESSGSPVFESQGVLQGYRGISRDITERKKADSEIRSSLEKEKELNELKSRFVSMVSHEFRTPLSTILLYTELLEHYHHKWDEEQKRQYFLRIQTAIKNMTNLLNDVLIIGKSEIGKLEFSPIFLNIDVFCRNLVSEMQLTAGSQQTIMLQSSSCFQKVYVDEQLLRQIFTNLLSNALKYSPQGGVINFSYYFQNEKLVFEVQDEGIGIPIEDQQHLFESFHRATNVGTIPGTGLGLAIVKECVKLHQGEISVNSQLGLGTKFVVKLPYQ
ncbi:MULTISPECIES: PAS domain S-box protein [Cyanophyceae]|uniref:PAS domain S-box protein n=1 Tax=Cyanophyceae TaxID=3028117 RepID=UPI0016825C85|nr:PAS domain S-box protein [Trichocoleus sp. FACHB-69]MBD1932099.1 PAS domain S-box protein [Trichocoleus sp. FACHB-69]